MIIEVASKTKEKLDEAQATLNKNQLPFLTYSQVIEKLIENYKTEELVIK